MSQPNVEVVRRAKEAFNRGDVDAWVEQFDPDVVYYDSTTVDTPSVIRGREQLREALEAFTAELDDFRADVELRLNRASALGDIQPSARREGSFSLAPSPAPVRPSSRSRC